MVLAMGTPPNSHENDHSASDGRVGSLHARVIWPADAPTLEQEAELIDRLFGDAIAQLFKDSS